MTDPCPRKEHQLLHNLRRAHTADNEWNQLARRVDGIDTTDIVPADRELDTRNKPRNTQDDTEIPEKTESFILEPRLGRQPQSERASSSNERTIASHTWHLSSPTSALHAQAVYHFPPSLQPSPYQARRRV